MITLPGHSRYAYSPIVKRPNYSWPEEGKPSSPSMSRSISSISPSETGLGMDPVHSGLQNGSSFRLA